MRDVLGKNVESDEFFVVDIDGPTRIVFPKQIEDILITTPDGDIFVGWDYGDPSEFSPLNALLLKATDNLKGFSKGRCTHLYMMPRQEGKTLRVYVVGQR